jgi:hypothetical protein
VAYTVWYSYIGLNQIRLNDSGNIELRPDTGNVVQSFGNVNAPNFQLTSDRSMKTNIQEYGPKVIDIRFREFEMKANRGDKRVGVVAQELEEKHPEFVTTPENGFKVVKYVDLIMAKLAEMEWRIKRLENSFVIS